MDGFAWLTVPQFADLAGIARQTAFEAVKRAMSGGCWRGTKLEVRMMAGGRGGRSSVRYEIALNSVPDALQKAFKSNLDVSGKLPAPVASDDYAPRIATSQQPYNAQAKPIEPLFARLDRYCFSSLPGYSGGDRTNKKTQNDGREPDAWAGSWESFCETVGGLIGYYHQRKVGGHARLAHP